MHLADRMHALQAFHSSLPLDTCAARTAWQNASQAGMVVAAVLLVGALLVVLVHRNRVNLFQWNVAAQVAVSPQCTQASSLAAGNACTQQSLVAVHDHSRTPHAFV